MCLSMQALDHLQTVRSHVHDQRLSKVYHQNNGSPLPRHNCQAAKTIVNVWPWSITPQRKNIETTSIAMTTSRTVRQTINLTMNFWFNNKFVHKKFPKLSITFCKLIKSTLWCHHQQPDLTSLPTMRIRMTSTWWWVRRTKRKISGSAPALLPFQPPHTSDWITNLEWRRLFWALATPEKFSMLRDFQGNWPPLSGIWGRDIPWEMFAV